MGRKYYHRGNPTSYKPTVKYSTSHHRYTHTAVNIPLPVASVVTLRAMP